MVATDELEKAKLSRDLLAVELKQAETGRGRPNAARSGQAREIQNALRMLLAQRGINMNVPGKAVFYNDLTGIVMVRATFDDLEIVNAAIATLGGSAGETTGSQNAAKDEAVSSYQNAMMRRYGFFPSKQ